jgi:hypothetical protein
MFFALPLHFLCFPHFTQTFYACIIVWAELTAWASCGRHHIWAMRCPHHPQPMLSVSPRYPLFPLLHASCFRRFGCRSAPVRLRRGHPPYMCLPILACHRRQTMSHGSISYLPLSPPHAATSKGGTDQCPMYRSKEFWIEPKKSKTMKNLRMESLYEMQ